VSNFVELSKGDSTKFLLRWRGRQAGPYLASVIEAKLANNEISLLHEIYYNGQWVTVRNYLAERKAPNCNWRKEPATEKQKEKLQFFGCTWDEGITAGQAIEALEECARKFPDAEAAYQKSLPATVTQKDKLRFFGCTWNGNITVVQAGEALAECAKQFPDREFAWQKQKGKLEEHQNPSYKTPSKEVTIQKVETAASQHVGEEFLPTAEQIAELRSFGKEPSKGLTYAEAKIWIEQCKILNSADKTPQQEVNIQTAETTVSEPSPKSEPQNASQQQTNRCNPATDVQKEKLYEFGCAGEIEGITAEQADAAIDYCIRNYREKKLDGKDIRKEQEAVEEVTIQEAAKLLNTNTNPSEYTIPAREVQDFAQHRPAIQKPATYKIITPFERFGEWLDAILKRNQTITGGHWLPLGPLTHVFVSDAVKIGLCRQFADMIESKGYCVEPDARFGSGTYDRDQTLALFKPLDDDPIQPSTAYLGAANLLRLCVLITTADGKIDLAELDVFHRAIDNQPGLTLTDCKRLLILEQLLAQELCSASKAAAQIAKSIPADKRLVVGKLLVEVAAANNVITEGERRVLGKIFKSLEIQPEMLEYLISQICPSRWPRPDSVEGDVSKNDRWLWNHWRTGHPGVVIDDTTLVGKRWNCNDWKALNARWQDLHDRLAARQKHFGKASGASISVGTVARGEQIQKTVAKPRRQDFTLDPDKIFAIQNDTKEVVAILSVLMDDEPEKTIAPAATITLPVPEIPKVSGNGNAAPQPTRFNGLDAAFHPILERLLTRDSWPKNDFKSLADEFHFMPLNIRDTLNEWADEALGDFILDGEDPMVIRRELIAKEKVYG
jgi:uncharacterized tellurite resistance protein B-like protein